MFIFGLLIALAGGFLTYYWVTAAAYMLSVIGATILMVGLLLILSHFGVSFLDIWLYAAALLLMYLAIMAIQSIPGTFWRAAGIVALIVIILAGIGFAGFKLLKAKNRLVLEREKITQAKAKVRIAKHKYLTAIHKTSEIEATHLADESEAVEMANRKATSRVHGATGDLGAGYAISAETVRLLSDNLSAAQEQLAAAISAYNSMISLFPMLIAAKLFKFEKEKTVDEENLEKSTVLQGFDEEEL